MFTSYLKTIKDKSRYDRTPQDWLVVYFFSGFAIVGGFILVVISAISALICLLCEETLGIALSLILAFFFALLIVVGFSVSKYLDEDWW